MTGSEFEATELHNDDDAYSVRPYAVTGGRVETTGLAVEALVTTLEAGKTAKGLTPENKKILQLAAEDFISIAELSAHCKLPLGVIRVLVSELTEKQYLEVHTNGPVANDDNETSGITLSLLESVLDGIAAL